MRGWVAPILLTILLTVIGLGPAQAQPVQLELRPTHQTLSPLVLGGFNFGNWMQAAEYRQALQKIAPALLRFPAGNAGDDSDLSEPALRLLKVNSDLLGKPALVVQTRVFALRPNAQNRPQDAAQAARDARDLGLEVAYWNIGNEPDLYALNRGDPSWTAERYCQTFRAQRLAILAVDPKARFAGPSVSGAVPARDVFLRDFVRLCGDVVDLLTWHEYPTDGSAEDAAALASVEQIGQHIAAHQALLTSPESNPLGHRRPIKLAVTEYGLSWKTNHPRHLSDQTAALWAAEAALRMAEGGLELGAYFALQGTGGHGLLDGAGVPRPSFYAFEQLRQFRGRMVEVRSSLPGLWAHAAQQDNLLTLLLINAETRPLEVATGFADWQAIGAKGFTAQTVNDEAEPIRFKLGNTLRLPARSLTRVVYKAQPVPLRVLAERRGLLIGAAVSGALYDSLEPEYGQILAREFSLVTAENSMKWEALSNERGSYSFAAADALVAFAQKNQQKIRGHTLVWHQQLPNWLRRKTYSREEMLAILKEHIETVVGHYKGRVAYWDVVNEAQADDGSGLRASLFRDSIGPDFLEYAFRYARAADPQAKLFYNDYSTEGLNPKSNQVYAMVKALKEQGVPIDGVGIQTHVDSSFSPQAVGMPENLRRLEALGLEVHITEMDVKLNAPGTRAERLEAQAEVYRETLAVCLAAPNCKAFTLWGFTDAQSWLAGSQPLIFDVAYQPKPAYHALAQALQNR